MKYISLNNTPNISRSDSLAVSPTLKADERGFPHVSWIENNSGTQSVYYTYFDGLKWSKKGDSTLIATVDNGVTESHGLTLDSDGNPHVAYADSENALYLSTYDSSWSSSNYLIDYEVDWIGVLGFSKFSSASSSSSSSSEEPFSSSSSGGVVNRDDILVVASDKTNSKFNVYLTETSWSSIGSISHTFVPRNIRTAICGNFIGIAFIASNSIRYNFFNLNSLAWSFATFQTLSAASDVIDMDCVGFGDTSSGSLDFVWTKSGISSIYETRVNNSGTESTAGGSTQAITVSASNVLSFSGEEYLYCPYKEIAIDMDESNVPYVCGFGIQKVVYKLDGATWDNIADIEIDANESGISASYLSAIYFGGRMNMAVLNNANNDVYYFEYDGVSGATLTDISNPDMITATSGQPQRFTYASTSIASTEISGTENNEVIGFLRDPTQQSVSVVGANNEKIYNINLNDNQIDSSRTFEPSSFASSIDFSEFNGEYLASFPYNEYDTKTGSVLIFPKVYDNDGTTIRNLGDYGNLRLPKDAKYDLPRNTIWISDTGNHRVLKINATTLAVDDSIEEDFKFPYAIDVNKTNGNIAISAYNNAHSSALVMYSNSGSEQYEVISTGDIPWSELTSSNRDGQLLVADYNGNGTIGLVNTINADKNNLFDVAGQPSFIGTDGMDSDYFVIYHGTDEDDIIEGRDNENDLINYKIEYKVANNPAAISKMDSACWYSQFDENINQISMKRIRFNSFLEDDTNGSSVDLNGLVKVLIHSQSRNIYAIKNDGTKLTKLSPSGESIIYDKSLTSYGDSFDILREDVVNEAVWVAKNGSGNILRVDRDGNIVKFTIADDVIDIYPVISEVTSFDYLWVLVEDEIRRYEYNTGTATLFNLTSLALPSDNYFKLEYQISEDNMWVASRMRLLLVEGDLASYMLNPNLWSNIQDISCYNYIDNYFTSIATDFPLSSSIKTNSESSRTWNVGIGNVALVVDEFDKRIVEYDIYNSESFENVKAVDIESSTGNAFVTMRNTGGISFIGEMHKDGTFLDSAYFVNAYSKTTNVPVVIDNTSTILPFKITINNGSNASSTSTPSSIDAFDYTDFVFGSDISISSSTSYTYVPNSLSEDYQHESEFYVDILASDKSGISQIKTYSSVNDGSIVEYEDISSDSYQIPKFSWSNSFYPSGSADPNVYASCFWIVLSAGILDKIKFTGSTIFSNSVIETDNTITNMFINGNRLYISTEEKLYVLSNEYFLDGENVTSLLSSIDNDSNDTLRIEDGDYVWSTRSDDGSVVKLNKSDLESGTVTVVEQYDGIDYPFKIKESSLNEDYFVGGSNILWKISNSTLSPHYVLDGYILKDFCVSENSDICMLFDDGTNGIIHIIDENDDVKLNKVIDNKVMFCRYVNNNQFYVLSEDRDNNSTYSTICYLFDINNDTENSKTINAMTNGEIECIGIAYDNSLGIEKVILVMNNNYFLVMNIPSLDTSDFIDMGFIGIEQTFDCDDNQYIFDAQSKVRVFVGSQKGYSDKWDSGEISTSLTSMYYGGGNNLTAGSYYYVHIQTYSESYGWSNVKIKKFKVPN